MIDQVLMERFFRNECTAEEKAAVIKFLDENPDAIDLFLSESESYEIAGKLMPGISQQWLGKIHREAFEKASVVRLFRRLSVAAAVVIIAGFAIFKWQQERIKSINPPVIAVKESSQPGMVTYNNSTSKEENIILPDGSSIRLAAYSSVKYSSQFKQDRERIVYLDGQAFFDVKHDKARAFIVNAGDIATIDIGTTFRISNRKGEDNIRVRLFTGEVQVKLNGNNKVVIPNKGLLSPGDEFVYSKKLLTAYINRPSNKLLVKAGSSKLSGPPARPDWFKFNGQPLSEVIEQLANYYQAEIYYNPADLKDKYFTGKFDRTDSLERMLDDIASLNDLSVIKTKNKIIIRK
ncbi:FecR family protein [Deminuibacter soli]|uniref:DUF4974 domain-containing protein n=1 Tax=Deminuibacter soli TaxID=2291815 RepID=A0A3E1NDY5_9BACT|nr:FecR domain-containing protein [Deminuibacter soli]RFM26170.1 DUF4974 domain-containing protein [Deminuibacter soli]